jgi:hypothetical protein
VFDDPNLVGTAGLVPVMGLAARAGLSELADRLLSVPTDKGANAGVKVASLVAGMVAGADSIDDLGVLRHGGMGRLFSRIYAPSTLGSFLRAFRFGHVRQLDAVAARFLRELAALTPVVAAAPSSSSLGFAFVDVDDTVIGVHGHAKQGAGFGYNHIRGLNALLATVTLAGAAPVIAAQRLRKGSCSSARGAKRLIADAVKTSRRILPSGRPVLVRMDSAFYSRPAVHAALAGGAAVSVTTRMDNRVKAAIASIAEDAWTPIEYTDAVFDETSGQWISRAEVAEITFTAFAAQPKADQVPGRLIVRRIPDFAADKHRAAGQDGLFDVWRFHAFFTTHRPDAARHGDRGQDPPPSRDHRTSPRRLEELRARAPAVGGVHRERGLARARRDRVQPDPCRCHPRRPNRLRPGPGNHLDRAPPTDPDPVPDRDPRPPTDPPPTPGLALADRLDPAQRPRRRPTYDRDQLTTPAGRPARRTPPWNSTGSEARHPSMPSGSLTPPKPGKITYPSRSVDSRLIQEGRCCRPPAASYLSGD